MLPVTKYADNLQTNGGLNAYVFGVSMNEEKEIFSSF